MTRVLGMNFSVRSGGNMADLAHSLLDAIAAKLPGVETELIQVSQRRISPCNGCAYECLLKALPEAHCPIEDDVWALWQAALRSDMLIYFIPTYGGLPPATWVAFQQRYHGVFRHLPPNSASAKSKLAVISIYDPIGSKVGDMSQGVLLHHMAAQQREVVSFEQIIPSNYDLNGLGNRLIAHPGVQTRMATLADRIVRALQDGEELRQLLPKG